MNRLFSFDCTYHWYLHGCRNQNRSRTERMRCEEERLAYVYVRSVQWLPLFGRVVHNMWHYCRRGRRRFNDGVGVGDGCDKTPPFRRIRSITADINGLSPFFRLFGCVLVFVLLHTRFVRRYSYACRVVLCRLPYVATAIKSVRYRWCTCLSHSLNDTASTDTSLQSTRFPSRTTTARRSLKPWR